MFHGSVSELPAASTLTPAVKLHYTHKFTTFTHSDIVLNIEVWGFGTNCSDGSKITNMNIYISK